MRILVISQYFFPENFRINDLVFSLSQRGHYVEVLTGKPNYPKGEYFEGYNWKNKSLEKINGLIVNRSNLILRKKGGGIRLFFNYLSFVFFGSLKLLSLKGKFDKILIYAPSPITVGILGIIAAKKYNCKSFLWVHDLWPESVQIAGGVNNKTILGMINFMTKLIYKFSDFVLVQSPKFKLYIKNQGVDEKKIIFYPYYAESFYKVVEQKEKYKILFPKGFNIVFAGNIGVSQSFDTIINAFSLIKDYNINLIVIGDGRDKDRIKTLVIEKNLSNKIFFLGSHPPEKMPFYFACADALLITLKKTDVFSYTIPGKLQSYLACGRPILGAIDGIGNEIISKSNSGYCCSAEDFVSLSKNIIKLSNDSDAKRFDFSRNAISYFEKNFKKEKLILRLEEILKN
jgi:glycosyltransferase involved in cell wall biosynthesis